MADEAQKEKEKVAAPGKKARRPSQGRTCRWNEESPCFKKRGPGTNGNTHV